MNVLKFVPDHVTGCSIMAWLQPEMTECSQRLHPAIIICPGGAYRFISEREGEPVAKRYYGVGFHTFILNYACCEEAKAFNPLIQLAATVAHIRNHSKQWHVDPNGIVVCGFSAGAHLAGSLGVLFNNQKFLDACPPLGHIRPDAMILGYPVITADENTHEETLYWVSGGVAKGSEEYRFFGLNNHVDSQTPPVFLWHTATDTGVSANNSLSLAFALQAAHVPYELHIFPSGNHGMSVCTKEVDAYAPYNGRWVDWSVAWLNRTLGYED